MEKLSKKNKNGFCVERFVKIVRTLPPPQCALLGELLQEFGRWLVYDSNLASTQLERSTSLTSLKYKDADRVARLVYDDGYSMDNAVKAVFVDSLAFGTVEELSEYAQLRLKHYSKLTKEQRNKDIIKRLLDGDTLQSVAIDYGLSTSQTHRINKRGY